MKRSIRDQQYIDRLKVKIARLEARDTNRLQYIRMLEQELGKHGGSQVDVYLRYVNWVHTRLESELEAQRAKEAGKTA